MPKYAPNLSPEDAKAKGFRGPVFHTLNFKDRAHELLEAVRPITDADPGHAIVIGGGKSGWEYVFRIHI